MILRDGVELGFDKLAPNQTTTVYRSFQQWCH